MNDIAMEFESVTKTFRIYHEKGHRLLQHLRGISRNSNFEELTVLQDISLAVKKGEMFGIIGRNGAGKTTLLRLVAGILKPDRGTIRINGSITPLLRLGTGFQQDLTARENIILYGIILGFSRKEITQKVQDILAFAELEKFADTKIRNFSSGMHSRLAFSTAIQVDPDILLVDEILAVGDAFFKQKSFEALTSFKKRGKTILYVSHSLESVKKLCDRAMLLHDGKIQAIGPPDFVVDAYMKFSPHPNKTRTEVEVRDHIESELLQDD